MADLPILDFRYPLALETLPDGTVALQTVVQDSIDDIECGLVLACELRAGDLPWAEDTGIPSALGGANPAAEGALLQSALRAIDTRPARIDVEVSYDDADERNLHLKVTV